MSSGSEGIVVPSDIDVVFVSDAFSDQYLGGAELTTDAIIEGCGDTRVFRLNSRDVNKQSLASATDKFWIFGNFFGMDLNLIPTIVANINYAIVDYDYKYCRYRSPEKHETIENKPCDCPDSIHGKMISSFFYGADHLFWMSKKQQDIYVDKFPFLESKNNTVLSSVFSRGFFERVNYLKNLHNVEDKSDKWIIVGSDSWIKGVQSAEKHCVDNNLEYEIVRNLSHDDLLEKLVLSKGLVFLPPGGDTCPRITIEAKMLGCELIINDNVQHKDEKWFSNYTRILEDYLKKRPGVFWEKIRSILDRVPTTSGYTTTKDCISQAYPFEQCIMSMLAFCDQVVVVDGGSKDGTWERLQELSFAHSRLLVERRERDWNHKRFAVFDGLQKAYARSLCTGDFCWQQDSDEIVHEEDYEKIKLLVTQIPKSMNLISLPVVEYWGGGDKVRVDVNPWKWRLSRNRAHITHGIPKHLRRVDENGDLYAGMGTDGCDYIDKDTYEVIPCANFYTQQVDRVKQASMNGDHRSLEHYENWFNNVISTLPGVHHYSWYDLERKIKTYRGYWSKHWQSLYDVVQEDTPENNMFFEKAWSEVTDDEIKNLSKKLASEMGGWIFHSRVDFSKATPSIDCERGEPEIMRNM